MARNRDAYEDLISQVQDLQLAQRTSKNVRYRILFLRRQWITQLRMSEVLKDAADKIEQASILMAQAYDKIDEYAHENAPDRTPD